MKSFIIVFVTCLLFSCHAQDFNWGGYWEVWNVIAPDNNTQCCVPQAIHIIQDTNTSRNLTAQFTFDTELDAECPAGLITQDVIVNLGQAQILNATESPYLFTIFYRPNNNTILVNVSDGCQIELGNENSTQTNLTQIPYTAENATGNWVLVTFYPPNQGDQCTCIVQSPFSQIADAATLTVAYNVTYPTNGCPEDIAGQTFSTNGSIAEDFGNYFNISDASQFLLPNGTFMEIQPAPFCISLWEFQPLNESNNSNTFLP